jgi:hypothetical protein
MNGATGEQWAPVGLFVYRRPEHARRMIESMRACEGAERGPIYVFADGPKTDAEIPAVEATRAVAHELLGERAVYVELERNRGLADSIIAGTTELCDRHGRAVIVEDDLILAPSFLRFLNQGLERYRDESRVLQVSGHMFDVPSLATHDHALFLPMIDSWGWATWDRAWDLFDPDATGWRERLSDPAQRRRFDLNGEYPYGAMLRKQQAGEIDSWAIRWYYTLFVHDRLALFPPTTLVANGGADRSGTNGRLPLRSREETPTSAGHFSFPDVIETSEWSDEVLASVGRQKRQSPVMKLARRIFQRL